MNKEIREKLLRPASDIFWEAVVHSSSTEAQCSLCGRLLFSDDCPGADIYRKNIEDGHKRLLDMGTDWPHWGEVFGAVLVQECPCNKAAEYEKSLKNDRTVILDYYRSRLKEAQNNVESDAKDLEQFEEPEYQSGPPRNCTCSHGHCAIHER